MEINCNLWTKVVEEGLIFLWKILYLADRLSCDGSKHVWRRLARDL
jgi:hypothetical protein